MMPERDTTRGDGTNRITGVLADRFARFTLAGRRRANDPAPAAEQFIALLTGPMEALSRFGTQQVDSELRSVARAAVHTFLQAFANEAVESTDAAWYCSTKPVLKNL